MKLLTRLQELGSRIELVPEGYVTDATKEELLEYRTLSSIRNVLTSKTNSSTIGRDEVLLLCKLLGWDASDFKKGKFHYEDFV